MKVRILGYYGGYPFNGIGTSSYLLTCGDYHLLIDCGSGDLLSLEKYLDPLQLNAVVLSHYHHDHMADVGVLQYYWQLHPKGRHEPKLPIYGNTEDPLNFESLNWMNSTEARGFSEENPLHLGPITIYFKRTHHPVPAFAMRIVENTTHHVLVYTADSNYFESLANFAQNANLLISDTNYYADKNHVHQRWHMTSTESGKLAVHSHSKRLLLSHLPQYRNLKQLVSEAQLITGNKIPVSRARLGQVVNI